MLYNMGIIDIDRNNRTVLCHDWHMQKDTNRLGSLSKSVEKDWRQQANNSTTEGINGVLTKINSTWRF